MVIFIDTLYRNAGGRAVDAAGLAFWLKAQAGPPAMTRGELVAGFINSLVIGTLNDDTAAFHGAVSKSMTTLSQNAQATKSSPDTAAFVNALALALSDVRARKDAAA